jgi:hypothetical protein
VLVNFRRGLLNPPLVQCGLLRTDVEDRHVTHTDIQN